MSVFGLHVACTNVDASAYPPRDAGWALPGSMPSAQQLALLVQSLHPGCRQQLLINPTAEAVGGRLGELAAVAQPDDLVIFTYVGHGAQVKTPFVATAAPPGTIASAEPDRDFEVSILLWDRMMVANEYARHLAGFRAGVRYVSIIDGCGLGTFAPAGGDVTGAPAPPPEAPAPAAAAAPVPAAIGPAPIPMGLDAELYAALYERNAAVYDRFLADPGPIALCGVNVGACEDGETAFQEGDGSGSFFSLAVFRTMHAQPRPADFTTLRAEVATRLRHMAAAVGVPVMHPTLFTFGAGGAADLRRAPLQ